MSTDQNSGEILEMAEATYVQSSKPKSTELR